MLKLRYSATSPFVRKVVVVALETGQDRDIERVKTVTSDPGLAPDNPLQKIPALTTEDGTKLIDSKVICEYLDQRKGGTLVPASGPKRWAVLAKAWATGWRRGEVGSGMGVLFRGGMALGYVRLASGTGWPFW